MDSCEWAIGNAEAFTERLAEELSGLDGANIHAIMGSEKQVQELIKLLDQALWELESTESRLQDYDSLLRAVRDSMELMGEKDNSLRVEDQNRRKLVTQIESLVVSGVECVLCLSDVSSLGGLHALMSAMLCWCMIPSAGKILEDVAAAFKIGNVSTALCLKVKV